MIQTAKNHNTLTSREDQASQTAITQPICNNTAHPRQGRSSEITQSAYEIYTRLTNQTLSTQKASKLEGLPPGLSRADDADIDALVETKIYWTKR